VFFYDDTDDPIDKGFIGYKSSVDLVGTYNNNFFDAELSNQNTDAVGGATPGTTAEMQTLSTFDNAGWDIVAIGNYINETWYIDDGSDYPRLGWQFPNVQFITNSSSGGESLAAVSVEITLSSTSTADVYIDYTVGGTATSTGGGADHDLADGTATITAGNTTTTIDFTVVNDVIDEENETVIITLSNPVNCSLGANTVFTYMIIDNDTAGITQSATTASVAEEGTTTGTYTLVLDSEPTHDVMVTITPDIQTTVSPSTLTFTSANWDTSQTITITAVDDSLDEDDSHSGTITHLVASTDKNYDGYSLTDVTVTITDNDTSGGGGVPITPSSGSGDTDVSVPMNQTVEAGDIGTNGKNLLMYINSRANFKIITSRGHKSDYFLKIFDLDLFNRRLIIRIGPYIYPDPRAGITDSEEITEIILNPDDKEIIDLDDDGVDDIEIEFEDIVINRVEITVIPIFNNKDNFWTTGRWLKIENNSSVYFLDQNNLRHAYPNQKIWESYFGNNFSQVEIVSAEKLASYPLDRNVPYNIGSLFKISSVPKVYVVTKDRSISWIKTEDAAVRLYGPEWNTLIHDLPDAFFGDYVLSEEIE
jgi:hypothetical protein